MGRTTLCRGLLALTTVAALAGCGGTSDTSPTAASPTGAGTTPASATGPASTPPRRGVPREARRVARDMVRLAVRPSARAARRVLAEEVALGLGRDLRTTRPRAALARADGWVLEADGFRGASGPLSALRLLADHAEQTGSSSVRARGGAFLVSTGAHPRCAAPPEPAPRGLADLRRVSLQPAEGTTDSCLAWFGVDLFVDPEGDVAAVTADLWEP